MLRWCHFRASPLRLSSSMLMSSAVLHELAPIYVVCGKSGTRVGFTVSFCRPVGYHFMMSNSGCLLSSSALDKHLCSGELRVCHLCRQPSPTTFPVADSDRYCQVPVSWTHPPAHSRRVFISTCPPFSKGAFCRRHCTFSLIRPCRLPRQTHPDLVYAAQHSLQQPSISNL